VWQDTLGEPAKLVCCAVQPFVFVGSMYKLSIPVTVAGDGVDDGVLGVQLGSSIGDLSCEIYHVLMDDDIGSTWALFGMVGVVWCARSISAIFVWRGGVWSKCCLRGQGG
jgi:hypothetical protein